jgi:DNA-binding transcriptional ArsR family regulator
VSVPADVFAVLADPTRRHMLDLLRARERAVGELVEAVGISQPGVSKQLRVLREAGLVSVREDGARRLYGLRAQPLRELDAWLARYRPFWDARLDALEEHLDRKHGRRR